MSGFRRGQPTRRLNHACEPNCRAIESVNRIYSIYIEVARDVASGEKFFIDYGLEIAEPVTELARREYACLCGALGCRGAMLASGV
ncbi:SET domain-containing protein-lysine N-methyltransferase [Burkholderia oklahomensis]|uniref:SET domain-containing protein-lysine N-methyltransferase n=1 Tax=Burkholderia oklahomensis TaxID=342113 RepID=UPI0009D96DA5|nr:SET domain-containing protein-lysine N-methyltransferase [Burkholderia oklahomensis]MBI0358372.1 SET domain-containing protein-lysine N-methyltransferase [Burkholderia oklahomensis]